MTRILKFIGWSIGFLLAALLTVGLVYRMPAGNPITATATVQYEMLDLGQGDFPRSAFEDLAGNRRIFLTNGPLRHVYASFDQVKACWPESPFEMEKKGYTVQVTFTVRKLLFTSGYTPARELHTQHVPGSPDIVK